MTTSLTGLSVVVPVFNSRGSLGQLCHRLEAVLHDIAHNHELILVNDGSRDDSWDEVCALMHSYPWIRGIDLMRNYGQHNALLCGIRAARYDVIVTMDDDLQHPPEEIPTLLTKLNEGYDVVYGKPRELSHGMARNAASRLTKVALKSSMGIETASHVSAFRAFRADVCASFANYRGTFVSIDVLLTWGTQRFAVVPVRHDRRTIGRSNYTFASLVRHAINMMTGYSTLPLQLASLIGFAFTIFGIGVLFYVLIRYTISGGGIPGFPFLASIIAIFSGAQLFALGIIGEYLARIHTRTLDRPSYVVRRSGEHRQLRSETPSENQVVSFEQQPKGLG